MKSCWVKIIRDDDCQSAVQMLGLNCSLTGETFDQASLSRIPHQYNDILETYYTYVWSVDLLEAHNGIQNSPFTLQRTKLIWLCGHRRCIPQLLEQCYT